MRMRRGIGDKVARSVLIVAAGLFAASATAVAQDTGPEWVSLTPEQAKIVFLAPGLKDLRVRYLRGDSEDHSYTVEFAFWSGTAAHHAKAVIQYAKLSPGYHYRARSDPKVFVESEESFEDKELVFEKLRRNGNRLGVIESRRFHFDDVSCLGFASYWGESGSDTSSAGTEMLSGYYCADPGRPLTDALRKAVIGGLGIKGKAVP